jgi:AdoMet-dependent heme synthase
MVDARLVGDRFPGFVYGNAPRNVYWEITIACDLACRHCRANAIHNRDPAELNTTEGMALLDDIGSMGSMLILTGGDPMKRPDLFDLIDYGRGLGIPISITPSTTPLLTRDAIARFRERGVAALGVSLDGPNARVHDAFRGVPGTFDQALAVLGWAREVGLPVQVNTTITRQTLPHLPALYALLAEHAVPPVRRWSLFLLVPIGRGAALGVPSAEEVERLFDWVYETAARAEFHVGTIEAPHYRRYWIERKLADGMPPAALPAAAKRMGFGARDGNGVVFVSHRGDVYPAGFLPHPLLGNVRERRLSDIYRDAPELRQLRDMDALGGKCGRCDYRWACGGSRARAYAMTGDPMASDPFCAYVPVSPTGEPGQALEGNSFARS